MSTTSRSKPRPLILYSCYSHASREGEHFVPDHIFSYVLAGTMEVYMGGAAYYYKEGDYRFFRRNQLTKFVKHPPALGGDFKSVSVTIDQATLQQLSAELNIHAGSQRYTGPGAILLRPNNLFRNFFASLTPYLNEAGHLSNALTNVKVKEAAMILLETNPKFKDILFDFTEPGKLDLEAYMNGHYKFNVDLSRFAYLTGRSLATFKRDFEKIYHTSPSRWLQQQRLKDAYYLIKEKGWKTTDVYLEVGFKDLSHFSYAFKKSYGVAPSMVNAR